MTQKDFLEKLTNLIREYENTEEVELSFAFFSDELNKRYVWKNEGFVQEDDSSSLHLHIQRDAISEKKVLKDLEKLDKYAESIEPNEDLKNIFGD